MNQPGTKHASAEPTRVENKRERRRGAAGRAAVLRRAPSDSDCSGETASLSADSGDRVVRPQPPPPRSGKSRSRRRGSEWEVLEGLKDGQRFEKRPDVFNGYLHKKRKWPLKGWHKRFFVIDGGILVYARSPTDVARGRLHGSVDVGLSVISAKARRRRIDIDADEFIYHLRAKTPDVFRTWLNVLKAHRLYRQHLLTFGARESVPKIHAPLDDMPPTDTSSRTSSSATDSSQINYHKDNFNIDFPCLMSKQSLSNRNIFVSKDISVCHYLADQKTTDRTGFIHNKRLCSMNCAKMLSKGLKNKHSPDASQGSTDGERQMHASDLNSLKIVNPFEESSAICKISLNSDNVVNKSVKTNEVFSYSNAYQNSIHSKLIERKQEATTSFSIFIHNAIRSDSPDSPMRRSKKSTNLVKYRNYLKEPTLKRPLSNCMLLTKYKLKVKHIDTMRYRSRAIACEPVTKVNNEIQVNIESKEDIGIQYEITGSECNRIAEQLMISLFDTHISTGKGDEVKYYVNQIVKDLYKIKRNKDLHPVKAIFRTLLEYWLKNTSISQVKEAMTRSKSISKQSNRLFTKDECLSSCVLDKICKQTQYHGFSELKCNKNKVKQISNRKKNERRNPPKHQSPKRDTASFEKERRVQELERLLKNTVYMCDAGNNQSLEKDIKITKTLIDNLGKLSRGTNLNKSNNSNQNDASNSSAEVPKIQDNIDRLISETSLPPDVAKDFFNAYLGTLLHDSSKSVTNTSTQSSDNIDNTDQPDCDVQVETVTRRLSKSVLTSKTNINKSTSGKVNANFERIHPFDDGQQYLKDMLDKITTIFSKIRNSNNKWFTTSKIQTDTVASKVDVKDELGRPVSDLPGKNLIHHDYDENSVVIDLTRYDLEHIAMFSDPAVKGNMSVTIKLKEKPINTGIRKRKQLSLKFSDGSKSLEFGKENNWTPYIDANDISCRFNKIPIDVNKNSYIECPANDLINLKPYLSSSETTSKACRVMHESDHSLNLLFKSSRSIHKEMLRSNKSIENEGTQSCFIMSTLKKHDLRNKVQSKKKVRLKECHGAVLNSSDNSLKLSITGQTNEARPIYEKSEPSIIDEKFIFVMLNNLSLLSRNAPSLNKDIKNLYLKLKTKYEQVLQNDNNVHGLSLLGKIYTEESSKLHNEKQTQTYIIIAPLLETCIKGAVSVGTNTNKILANRFHNITSIDKDRSDIGVETEDMLKLNKYEDDGKKCTSSANVPQTNIANNMASNVSTANEMKSTERGTSNPDWFKRTKECGINTALRYIFNNNRSDHLRIAHAAKTVQLDREFMRKNKNFSPKLLPSSFNISMQSETYWKSNTSVKETEKEFKSYQLFLDNQYPVVKLSSLTTSCTKEGTSDDLKTLYRCSSDPSYCSGLISPTSPPIRGPQFVSGTPGGRLASWIIESGGPLENASRELGQAQLSIQQMQRLLDALEMQQQVHHDTDIRLITKVEVDVL